jgi:hypothetical protein
MPFEAVKREWTEDVVTLVSERFERRLAEEIGRCRSELLQELHESIAAVRAEIGTVRDEMANMRVEWLRWSFLFWLGQVAATATMLTYMLRALGK